MHGGVIERYVPPGAIPFRNSPNQGGLAGLARPVEQHNRALRQGLFKTGQDASPDHGCNIAIVWTDCNHYQALETNTSLMMEWSDHEGGHQDCLIIGPGPILRHPAQLNRSPARPL
jgi:hypothetical protein